MASVGIDFGTTNSALAVAKGGGVEFAHFDLAGKQTPSFRSVLFYDPEADNPQGSAGPQAITDYLGAFGEGRLVQSVKTYLASELFQSTIVLGRKRTVEDLVTRIVSELWRSAAQTVALPPAPQTTLVMGRPVHFAGGDKGPKAKDLDVQDTMAQERLRTAARQAGFDNVVFELEPIAAAFHYESTLTQDALVLVADFGGGTSDFCLMQMGPGLHKKQDRQDDILATSGVGIAGDDFDAKLIREVVAPLLGAGSTYTEMGSTKEIPPAIFRQVERWHHLSFLKSASVMGSLERMLKGAAQPDGLRALIQLVEWNQGFHLHKCVERTKVALSSNTQAEFVYEEDDAKLRAEVNRDDFETWIEPEVAMIAGCVDLVLERASVSAAQVDRVFMTGGTSFVPAVRRVFESRFGADKLNHGDELLSIASGLALRGAALTG